MTVLLEVTILGGIETSRSRLEQQARARLGPQRDSNGFKYCWRTACTVDVRPAQAQNSMRGVSAPFSAGERDESFKWSGPILAQVRAPPRGFRWKRGVQVPVVRFVAVSQ